MKEKIIKFFDNIIASLHTDKGGFSGRKLTALAIIIMDYQVHKEWVDYAHSKQDFALLGEILMIDYCMVAICLGLVTMEAITKFKNGYKNEKATADTPTT